MNITIFNPTPEQSEKLQKLNEALSLFTVDERLMLYKAMGSYAVKQLQPNVNASLILPESHRGELCPARRLDPSK